VAKTISIHVNTDPTHTPDVEANGFPAGSVTLTFFPDNDDYAPGTDGLDVGAMGSISIELHDSIARKYDGWYFFNDPRIAEFPNELRDTIVEFKTQATIAQHIHGMIKALAEFLPSRMQTETVLDIGKMCKSIALGQTVVGETPVWHRDDPEGWILVDTAMPEFIGGPIFKSQEAAFEVADQNPQKDLKVMALHSYVPFEEPEVQKTVGVTDD
jgi:hypothetical protein